MQDLYEMLKPNATNEFESLALKFHCFNIDKNFTTTGALEDEQVSEDILPNGWKQENFFSFRYKTKIQSQEQVIYWKMVCKDLKSKNKWTVYAVSNQKSGFIYEYEIKDAKKYLQLNDFKEYNSQIIQELLKPALSVVKPRQVQQQQEMIIEEIIYPTNPLQGPPYMPQIPRVGPGGMFGPGDPNFPGWNGRWNPAMPRYM